jgi:hypothetical protein
VAIVLMLAERCHRLPNRSDAREIALNPVGLMRKALLGCRKGGIVAMRQNEWLAEEWASHLVQMTDVDERYVMIEAKGPQNRSLGILGVKPIDFVQ